MIVCVSVYTEARTASCVFSQVLANFLFVFKQSILLGPGTLISSPRLDGKLCGFSYLPP